MLENEWLAILAIETRGSRGAEGWGPTALSCYPGCSTRWQASPCLRAKEDQIDGIDAPLLPHTIRASEQFILQGFDNNAILKFILGPHYINIQLYNIRQMDHPTFFYSTLKSSAWLSHIMNSLQDHDIPPDECGSRSEGRGASWRNPILSLVFTAFGADQAPLRSGTAQDHRVLRSQRLHRGICLWHCYHRWFWYWILSVSKNVTNRVTGSFGNPATLG